MPNAPGAVATFNAVEGVSFNVNLNGQQATVGELNILGDVYGGYFFNNGTLTFSDADGRAVVNVVAHNLTHISDFGYPNSVSVELASDTVFDTIGTSATLHFGSGAAISGPGALIKQGLGTLTLSGSNIYTGGTTISAGTLVADHRDSGNVIDAMGTGLITLNGGHLHSSASSSTLNDYLIVAGTTSTISTATGTTLWLNGGGGQYFSLQGDVVVGASDGAGTVVMDVIGTPTSSDATITVAYGRLVNGNSSLGNITTVAGATRVASGATLDMSTYGDTIRNLQDASPGNGGTVTWSGNLNVQGGSFTGQFGTSQGGILVKGSTDTLLLNGDNYNFSGTTTVAEGKLIVGDANNSSAALGGAINVLSGATLGGYGSVGETTVQSGGILSPGNSIGILTVDDDLMLAPGSTLEVEIAANGSSNRRSDIVGVTGMATISGGMLSVTAIEVLSR
ncbi:autotransporter-associated beta strand repeat-containing protein [Brucella tritici]|uniref:autotransporter-associated beta strand repeat-containing protein n=1 Tax=Brucella tritici TaxID=94626 RepID=UPI001590F904|nr:autotransporter-associated beta strand repeat-containing protein [Brucella tritici]